MYIYMYEGNRPCETIFPVNYPLLERKQHPDWGCCEKRERFGVGSGDLGSLHSITRGPSSPWNPSEFWLFSLTNRSWVAENSEAVHSEAVC